MRRLRHVPRGFGGPKLTAMVLMLGIVGLVIYQTTNMARSGIPHQPAQELGAKPASLVYDGFSQQRAEKAPVTPDEDRIDLDALERRELDDELSSVSDATLSIMPEEMFAYSRLLHWVDQLTFRELADKATPTWTLHDLMQSPRDWRGELIRLELNVVRILKYAARDQKSGESRDLYEVWGWSSDTKSWLYVAVVPELPSALKASPNMEEKAILVGYFFKLQGYHEAGAKPHAPPLKAPLIIGRLAWKPSRHSPIAPAPRVDFTHDYVWYVLGGLFVCYLGLRFYLTHRKMPVMSPPVANDQALAWLETAGDHATESNPAEDATPEDTAPQTLDKYLKYTDPKSHYHDEDHS